MSTPTSWPWALLVAVLGGGKLPELPAFTEARRHVAHDEPASPEEERAALLGDRSLSLAELGRALGVSRQRAFQLRRAARGGRNLYSLEPAEPSGSPS
jgi:hypothetical protein